jgi:hypothetical protein
MDSGVYQDFYLCPKHNDPDRYHAAMGWAEHQFEEGVYVDFSDISSPLLSPEVEKWEIYRPTLPEQVPEVSDAEVQMKLPNRWQPEDPRLEGCLEVSYAIVGTWDTDWSPFLLDKLDRDSFPKPLELAEAMKKVVRRIETLTENRPGEALERM